ncbi:MAG: peptide-methionine (R)-S-oxide reductase MsrB [Saprospiraceae bacterium]|nr:peptide-methionine (R)-S-oxide reductase MsrB [Saprospiraceae bacterium]
MLRYLIFCFFLVVCSCKTRSVTAEESPSSRDDNKPYFINTYGDTIKKIILSPDEWKKKLSPQEFYVLREKGTERAFTGAFHNHKTEGFYTCKGCDLVLFASKHKFDSGTGWPSFYEVLDSNAVQLATDYDLGYPRTEVMCGRCGGHMGHVFPDGPPPTGLRYCINSVSLGFIKTEYNKK